jgi:Plasma-membrane choline transporter
MNSEKQHANQDAKVMFPTGPQYKDLWAVATFGAGSLAFAILSIWCFARYSLTIDAVQLPFLSQGAVIGLFGTVLATGGLTSFGYFFLLSKFAGTMISITLVLSVIIQICLGGFLLYTGNYFGAILIISAIISGYLFWQWRSKISFAKVVIKHVTKVINYYPGLWVVTFTGLVAQLGITTWVVFALIYWHIYIASVAQGVPGAGWATFFLLFIHHWISAVITSSVHMANSGVMATAYFKGR